MTPDDLIQKYLDGIASPEEVAELGRLLAQSPEAAGAFARASRRDWELESLFREDLARAAEREQIRRAIRPRVGRPWLAAGMAAGILLLLGLFAFWKAPRQETIAFQSGGASRELRSGDRIVGKAEITMVGEATRLITREGTELSLEIKGGAKHVTLFRGELEASVSPQPPGHPMTLATPQALARVLGTRFRLSTSVDETRLEVTEGKVSLTRSADQAQVEVAAGQTAVAGGSGGPRLAARSLEEDRFLALWKDLHHPAKGYFSPEGIPYHSVETLIVDAPDYGHLSTSETFSYWLWLEAAYGRVTGDWSWFRRAWSKMEEVLIPGAADQPTARLYDPQKPATAVREGQSPLDYPVGPDPGRVVGRDSLGAELQATYGSADLYAMHWLVDADDWYGYGRRGQKGRPAALINTFQRGPRESVWKAIPHPSWEDFRSGGPHGFLDLFLQESTYQKQWRYTCAPDADARAVQAIYWAYVWSKDQDAGLPLDKARRLGDSLRYALREKYFMGSHSLIGWSYSWGGSIEPEAGWAWRAASDQAHIGYQNPLVAWVLSSVPSFRSASPEGPKDWSRSLDRQLEFYRWLQSSEGALAGGASAGGGDFHGMGYREHPVFLDPPSNAWFGWQAWAMERLAQYARLTQDPRAQAVLDRWTAWAKGAVVLGADGSFAVPSTLAWRGTPGNLHVSVLSRNQDVGVAGALARTMALAGETALARELLGRMWRLYRDDLGVAAPEAREDYGGFLEPVPVPAGWKGNLGNGESLRPGATFLDLRSKYRGDPAYPKLDSSLRAGVRPVFRYHRFWAQVEVALAYAEMARLGR